ncbi:MAG: Fe-S cluster assembly protein SufD [Pyrinomonadaceae bacterium]
MVTELQKENSYQQAFRALQEGGAVKGASRLSQLREGAMERFVELGFPSVKEEEWKYTNVAAIARAEFPPAILFDRTPASEAELELISSAPETRSSQLVFVDGGLRKDLSTLTALPSGVVTIDLGQAINDERYSDIVRTHLARQADYVVNGFTALNTAFINNGAFVYIPTGVVVETPIHLLFIANSERTANLPRVLIVSGENSKATILENYVGTSNEYLTNSVVEVVLEEGARLEHYKVQRESVEAFHVATTAVGLGRNASYDTTTITFGAQLSRHDIVVTMDHEGAECWVDGLYLVTGNQHADTHSVIDHRSPHCTSHQLYKGILDGKSRAVFNGKVFVRHNAQKTDAMQTNKNLLLSNEARVDTKPQLEILADDVKCAHGAAVGQIDEEELFYLETRGIHPDLGRNLLTYGFAEEVIAKIKIDSIRNQLDEAVLHRLNTKLEA